MNMTKIAAILPLLLTGSAFAQDPFYTITEMTTAADRGSANFGPWPVSISGDGSTVASIAVTSNWYSYFRMAPSAMDLAHRFRYENGCTSYLSSATCSAYLNTSNWAATWFADLSSNAAQTYNVVSGSATAETDDAGIITKYGADSTVFAGYVSVDGHKRKAIANSTDLTDGTTFASAYDVIAVGSDYLAVGTESTTTNIVFNQCYSGSEITSYAKYCPGYNTKATFWLVNNPTTSKKTSSPYITPSTTYPYTGSAIGIAQVDSNNNYIAVGYSSTAGYSSYAKNLAVYWNLEAGTLSSTPVAVPIFSGDDNPGTSDDNNPIDNSWAVGINNNGYIVGNRVYRKLVSRNYPTQMFVAKFSSGAVSSSSSAVSLPSAKIGIPVSTSGVNSEAAALNNHDLVVGWTDERSDVSKPVYGSVPRLQEAFLYNINTGTRYAINDLICSGAATCSQNGKYYYIEYANGITDDGTIVASARRFDNYSDWSTLSNGTSVVVRLNVSSSTAFDSSNYNVPSDYVITNQLPVFDYGASSGGGSFGIFGLLAMAGAAAVGQYRRFVKKAS